MPGYPNHPQKHLLVHGDPDAATVFQQVLKDNHFNDVLYPPLGDSVEI
jgi:hypothetical protein